MTTVREPPLQPYFCPVLGTVVLYVSSYDLSYKRAALVETVLLQIASVQHPLALHTACLSIAAA